MNMCWLKLKDHPSGAEIWVNFDHVAYFYECVRDGKFCYTELVFCAKGDYTLTNAVQDRMDEIKTKLAEACCIAGKDTTVLD